MESTVTLVRLANRSSHTTNALTVHSAARPSALSRPRADRSLRPTCAAASNSYGGESWLVANFLSTGSPPSW